jgi:hypothetical protein
MLIVMIHVHRGQHFIKEVHHSGRSVSEENRSSLRGSYSFTLSTHCHSGGNTGIVETLKSDIKDGYCVPLTLLPLKIAFKIQHKNPAS